jgi:hypothetical protein
MNSPICRRLELALPLVLLVIANPAPTENAELAVSCRAEIKNSRATIVLDILLIQHCSP